jgi:peptide/nickel transport system permease protein
LEIVSHVRVPYSARAAGAPASAQAFEKEEVTMSSPADLMAQGEDERLVPEEAPAKEIVGRSPTQIAFERLRHDKVAVVCFCIVTLMVLLTIFAPLICKALGITWDVGGPDSVSITDGLDPYNMPVAEFGPPYGPFTWAHPLGIAPGVATDNLAYLLYGMRDSLFISVIATVISVMVGLGVGLAAGFSRGWLDRVLTFVIDLFLSFPFILFALAVAPIITQRFDDNQKQLQTAQLWALIIILSVFGWTGLARLVRGQVLSMREREFILAAQVIGASTGRILIKEMIPNLIATLVVVVSLSIPAFIAAEVGLSFLGLGLSGLPSMGQMIHAAGSYYDTYPLYLWAPVTALLVLVLSLNLLGDSIRDAFDPKTRR